MIPALDFLVAQWVPLHERSRFEAFVFAGSYQVIYLLNIILTLITNRVRTYITTDSRKYNWYSFWPNTDWIYSQVHK